MTKQCPVTGKPIARRYAVHRSVLDKLRKGTTTRLIGGKLMTIPSVVDNPTGGTLRGFVFDRQSFKLWQTMGGTI